MGPEKKRTIYFDDLPDEIIEKILIEATTSLEESMMAASVSRRWRCLMQRRLSMVKYLLEDQWSVDCDLVLANASIGIPKASYLFLHENGSDPNILASYIDWLPSLMVIEIKRPETVYKEEFLLSLINERNNIKGFSWYPRFNRIEGARHIPDMLLPNIDMVAIFPEPFSFTHTTLFYCLQSINQLYIANESWSPSVILPRFNNLRRLHMLYHDLDNISPRLLSYNGPVLENLEILELSFAVELMYYHLTHLLNFCPKLHSLFLKIESVHHDINGFTSNRKFFDNVENLVIEIGKSWASYCRIDDWICFMEIVRIFPNLKNLALRNVYNLTEDLLITSLQWSSKLKFLDIKISEEFPTNPKTTAPPTLNADNIGTGFYFYHRRVLNCLVRPYSEDYHSAVVQKGTWHVKEGFDFMLHVFSRDFEFSPVYLIDLKTQLRPF